MINCFLSDWYISSCLFQSSCHLTQKIHFTIAASHRLKPSSQHSCGSDEQTAKSASVSVGSQSSLHRRPGVLKQAKSVHFDETDEKKQSSHSAEQSSHLAEQSSHSAELSSHSAKHSTQTEKLAESVPINVESSERLNSASSLAGKQNPLPTKDTDKNTKTHTRKAKDNKPAKNTASKKKCKDKLPTISTDSDDINTPKVARKTKRAAAMSGRKILHCLLDVPPTGHVLSPLVPTGALPGRDSSRTSAPDNAAASASRAPAQPDPYEFVLSQDQAAAVGNPAGPSTSKTYKPNRSKPRVMLVALNCMWYMLLSQLLKRLLMF